MRSTVAATRGWSPPPPASAFVYLDLGGRATLTGARWFLREAGCGATLAIAGSDDKRAWTTYAVGPTSPGGSWMSVAFAGVNRYVRFHFSTPGGAPALGCLAEAEVWGTGVAAAAETPIATATATASPATAATATATGAASTATPEPAPEQTATAAVTATPPLPVATEPPLPPTPTEPAPPPTAPAEPTATPPIPTVAPALTPTAPPDPEPAG